MSEVPLHASKGVAARLLGAPLARVQLYLAHKKHPPRRAIQ